MPQRLTNPPIDDRSRERWMQHAAGHIIFQSMRQYAIDHIPEDNDPSTKEKIIAGIDDAIYGLMDTGIILEKNREIDQEINTKKEMLAKTQLSHRKTINGTAIIPYRELVLHS